MRSLVLPLCGLLLLFAGTAVAHAGQSIYRCIGAHGEPVFSGQPCGPPAPPEHLPGAVGATGSSVGQCATSPQALRQAIAAAFAAHDVNQFAGLLVWRGIGQASARASLHALSQWLRQPLSGIATTYADGPPGAGITGETAGGPNVGVATPAPSASTVANGAPTGFAVSTGGGDGGTRDFGVLESGGCWWLTF